VLRLVCVVVSVDVRVGVCSLGVAGLQQLQL
jgi:hypothetical protein